MPNNPFICLTIETQDIESIRLLRVDRSTELDLCVGALVDRRQNVLLYGSRGVGKSFLLRLLQDRLQQTEAPVFPVFVRLSSLGCYGRDDVAASFSRAVLLQVCCEAWTGLLGKRYLDLRERLDETGREISVRNEAERTVQRIYSILMTSERRAMSKHFTSFGVSVAVKGEKGEEAEYQRQQSDVLPFEFAEFIGELTQYVLVPHQKKRLVVLCDEANHMPLFDQEQILERYLELFNAKQVQFLFVAGVAHWEDSTTMPSCFETRIQLQGFPTQQHIQELIDKAASSIPIVEDAVALLFTEHSGHPRRSLEACNIAFQRAQASRLPVISVELLREVCSECKERLEQERQMMFVESNRRRTRDKPTNGCT